MFDILMSGGWVMIILILASILALAICIERFLGLKESKIIPDGFTEQLVSRIRQKPLSQSEVEIIREESAVAAVLAAGIERRGQSREAAQEAMELEGLVQVTNMERFLNLLGTIAQVAPLLGLLGTVLGMIDVFSVIMETGADKSGLAGGISQALVTTAAGLFVAIPSLFFYRYFNRRIEEYTLLFEQNGQRLLDFMFKTDSYK